MDDNTFEVLLDGRLYYIGSGGLPLNEIYSTGYHKIHIANGFRHRLDGPAIEAIIKAYNDTWYYQGREIKCSSQEEFEKLLKLKAFW